MPNKRMIKEHEWIIMPCYNEARNISEVIRDVKEYCNNIVIIDDGSSDDTFEIASKLKVFVLKHVINLGKGAALKTGADFAVMNGARKLVFIDSDGQHEPKEIPKFFNLLDEYDVVFGSRKLNKNMPGVFRIGNFLLSTYTYLLFGVKLSDTQSGYRALTAQSYKKIRWKAKDYSVEGEMIAHVGKRKLKYKEIEINTIYKNKYKGTTVLDGIKIGLKMLLIKIQR